MEVPVMCNDSSELSDFIKASYTSWAGVKLFWAWSEVFATSGKITLHRSTRTVLLALLARTFRIDPAAPDMGPGARPIREQDLYNYSFWCGLSRASAYRGLAELRHLGVIVDAEARAFDPDADSEAVVEIVDEHALAGLARVPRGVINSKMRNPDHGFLTAVTNTRLDPREEVKGVELDVIRFVGYATSSNGVLDITNNQIAAVVGCSERPVRQAITALKTQGALMQTRRGAHNRGTGAGLSSKYDVNFAALVRYLYGEAAVTAGAAEGAELGPNTVIFPMRRQA